MDVHSGQDELTANERWPLNDPRMVWGELPSQDRERRFDWEWAVRMLAILLGLASFFVCSFASMMYFIMGPDTIEKLFSNLAAVDGASDWVVPIALGSGALMIGCTAIQWWGRPPSRWQRIAADKAQPPAIRAVVAHLRWTTANWWRFPFRGKRGGWVSIKAFQVQASGHALGLSIERLPLLIGPREVGEALARQPMPDGLLEPEEAMPSNPAVGLGFKGIPLIAAMLLFLVPFGLHFIHDPAHALRNNWVPMLMIGLFSASLLIGSPWIRRRVPGLSEALPLRVVVGPGWVERGRRVYTVEDSTMILFMGIPGAGGWLSRGITVMLVGPVSGEWLYYKSLSDPEFRNLWHRWATKTPRLELRHAVVFAKVLSPS